MKLFRITLAAAALIILTAGVLLAQSPERQNDGRSFSVSLYVVSSGSERGPEVAGKIKEAISKVGGAFDISSLRLASVYYQRIASGGSGESNSIQPDFAAYSMENNPSYTEWGMNSLDSQGPAGTIGFRHFGFKARVPSTVNGAIQYFNLESNVNNLRVWVGKPAVVSTLKAPMSNSVLFLVVVAEMADPA